MCPAASLHEVFDIALPLAAKPKHGPPGAADETLNGVLRNVINEVGVELRRELRCAARLIERTEQFLSGDFEMIRVFVSKSANDVPCCLARHN